MGGKAIYERFDCLKLVAHICFAFGALRYVVMGRMGGRDMTKINKPATKNIRKMKCHRKAM